MKSFNIGKCIKAHWPMITAILFPLLLTVIAATPIGSNFLYLMFVMPVLFIAWVVLGVVASFVIFRSMRKKAWIEAISFSILPMAVVLVACNPLGFVRVFNHVGAGINLLFMQNNYLEAIKKRSLSDNKRLVMFDRGGMVWSGMGTLYDESDEVLLPENRQSSEWREKAKNTELSCGAYDVRPLWGHFYYVAFSC